jgi:uncharacterized membrane-anchored protein
VLVFGAANGTIMQNQALLDNGRQVLLRLETGSLMRSLEFMLLRYDPLTYPDREEMSAMPRRGTVVLELDADGVGRFARPDDGTPLAEDEIRLAYELDDRHRTMRYGADSFHFDRSDARRYSMAVYGVLRVDAEGDSIVAGLAGKDRQVIQPE